MTAEPMVPHDGSDPGDGKPVAANATGHAAGGTNAQSGTPAAVESERTAPGISTDKKADDTK